MEINDELIEKLESLSKLSLNEEEKAIIKRDLDKILDMIGKIQELDTTDVLPLSHLTIEGIGLRNDVPVNLSNNEEALQNAPERSGPYLTVPKVIDL